MPTITIKTEAGGWFPYPREAIDAKSGLSWEAMGLLAYLLGHGDGYSMHFDTIAKDGPKAGAKTIPAIFRELQDAGFVRKQRVSLPNGATEWQAVVSDRSTCKESTPPALPPPGFVAKPAAATTETAAAWPKGLNKKQIAALEEAGYDPQTAAVAKPADLLVLPGIAAGAVKLLTGLDIRTQLPAEQTAAQREIMEAYYKALGYSPAQQKMVNGAREGAAAKRLAQAGYDATTVIACYRHFKTDPFWSSRHLSLQHVATNISAWQASGTRPDPSVLSVPRGAPIGKPWHPNPNIRAMLMTLDNEGRATPAALARWNLTWEEVYGEPEPTNL